MATYSNNNKDDVIFYGSEFKLNISMDPIDGQHMSDVDFSYTFICGEKSKTLDKSEMRAVYKQGENFSDNYVAPLNSNDFGKGMITIRYVADITDEAFTDGFRHEIIDIPTKMSSIVVETQTQRGMRVAVTQHQDISGKANTADLATVATSDSYTDLSDKPTISTVPSNLVMRSSQSYTIWTDSEAAYTALGTYSNTTLYFITES